jgi:4-amino-4-deoxy-L-arabinose transferase-like glycosyltransferase
MTHDNLSARQLFFYTLTGTVVLRLFLSAAIPLTSDEAYFFLWGHNPDYGYYDHPPMVGWWLSGLLYFGDALWWLRIPALLTPIIIAFGIVWLLRKQDEEVAWLAAALFLVSPLSILNVLITTDTPVMLLGFLSMASFFLAVRNNKLHYYALAGLFLGLGLLSKYFAGLIAIAMAAYLLFAPDKYRVFRGLLIIAFISALLFAINIYWNYTHCWDNFLFNFLNRNKSDTPWHTPLVYLLTLIYFITPPIAWYLFRGQRRETLQAAFILSMVLFLVPITLLGLLSFKKVIGLHWLLAFQFLPVLILAQLREPSALSSSWKFNSWFSLAHVIIVLIIVITPWQDFNLRDKHKKAVIDAIHGEQVWAQLEPLALGRHVFTHSYAGASQMTYYAGRLVGVYGEGSSHAREHDKLISFAELDGDNFLVFLSRPQNADQYLPYFDSVEFREITVMGQTFEVVLGNSFRYPVYRDRVLRRINERFYQIPMSWPVGGCYFKERYNFQ